MNIEKIFENGLKSAYNDLLNEINTIYEEDKYIDEDGYEQPLYCEHDDILRALISYIEKQLKNI